MKYPKQNSKTWKKIVSVGCGLKYDEYNGDYDCEHGYDWACDYCPVNIDKWKKERTENDI